MSLQPLQLDCPCPLLVALFGFSFPVLLVLSGRSRPFHTSSLEFVVTWQQSLDNIRHRFCAGFLSSRWLLANPLCPGGGQSAERAAHRGISPQQEALWSSLVEVSEVSGDYHSP